MGKIKRLVSFILLITFVISTTSLQVLAENTEEYFMTDEFTSGEASLKWNFNRAVAKDDVLVLAEGVSASNGSVAATATLSINETGEQNVVIDIGFDVKPGLNLTTITQVSGLKSSVMPVTFDKTGEICINSYDASVEKAKTYTKYIPDNWYYVHTVIDQTAKRMTTVIYDKATGEIVAQKQVTDYKPFDSWADAMCGGLKTFSFQTNMGNNKDFTPSMFDNLKIKFIPLAYSVTTEAMGNNFGREGTDDIKYKIVNNSKEAYECELVWKVDEVDLGFMKEGTEKFSIDGLSEKEIVIGADIQRYGLYKISSKILYKNGDEMIDFGNDAELYFSKVLSSDPGEHSERMGFASNSGYGGSYSDTMKLLEMAGATGTRAGHMSWNAVQNGKTREFDYTFNKSAIDTWEESAMDSNVCLLAYGHKTLIEQVDFAGNPAEPNFFRPPRTPEEMKLWGDYVDYVIERVGDFVDYYELWNEYSGSIYSNVYGGGLYAEMCKETYERIKKNDPTAKLIAWGGVMMRDTEFIEEFFEAGGNNYCDIFSIHPYNSGGGDEFPGDYWYQPMENCYNLIRSYEPNKPIFFTEIGWSSYWGTTDEAVKGRAIVKANVVTLARGWADKVYIHIIQNIGLNPNDREHQFGALTAPGDYRGLQTALPAYVMFAAMNKLLPGNITCDERIEKETRLISAYNVKREDGKNVAVMWAGKLSNVDLSIDLGCNSVDTYDEYGNFIETVYSDTGVFDFGLSDKLMYAVGEFTKFEDAETVVSHKNAEYLSTLNDVATIRINDKLGRNGTVKVEHNGYVTELMNDCVMKNGVAEIQFKTSSSQMGDFPLNFKVYDENGKCIYVAQNTFTIDEPISITAKSANYFGLDSRWGIELEIHNNANVSSVKGTASITGPETIAGKCVSVPFVDIRPQGTEKVYINLPEMLKKRTVTVQGEVELDYGYKVGYSQYLDFTAAYYANQKPIIDGKLGEGEWAGTAMAASDASNWTSNIKDQPWRGPDDNSLDSMKMMWDEDNLYLMAVVKDDVFVKTPANVKGDVSISSDPAFYLWQYDSIQFAMEDEYFNVPNRLNYPFAEIGLALGDNGPYVYRFSGQTELAVGVVENSEVAITVEGNETIYECAIPWSEIRSVGYKPDESLIYSFAALVNDNDGNGRKGYTMYNDGIGSGKYIEKFGQMTLKR